MDSSNPNTATYLQYFFIARTACLGANIACSETQDAAHSAVLSLVIKKILPVVQDFTEIKHL